jgi:hypothetical protein
MALQILTTSLAWKILCSSAHGRDAKVRRKSRCSRCGPREAALAAALVVHAGPGGRAPTGLRRDGVAYYGDRPRHGVVQTVTSSRPRCDSITPVHEEEIGEMTRDDCRRRDLARGRRGIKRATSMAQELTYLMQFNMRLGPPRDEAGNCIERDLDEAV